MTVGHELEKVTGLKLFHNHMTIELVAPFFSYSDVAGKRLVNLFREEIFKEVAKSDLEGLIFTYVWALDKQEDWDYVDHICQLFKSKGGTVYFVELEANFEERLDRNKSPHRLSHKPTKRDLERSEQDLKNSMEKYRLNSLVGEVKEENYMRIDNTSLSAEEVAGMIKERFQL